MDRTVKVDDNHNGPFVVFRTISSVEISSDSLLQRLSQNSRLTSAELRQRVIGHGLNRFPLSAKCDPEIIIQTLRDHNVTAALISHLTAKPQVLNARSLTRSGNSFKFYDSKKEPILTISKNSELLIVTSDISGNDQHRRVLRSAYGTSVYNDFKTLMKAIAIYDPVVDIYCCDHPEQVMRIDPKKFSFLNLESSTAYSKSLNLSILVFEIVAVCKKWSYDDYFGLSDLSIRCIKELSRSAVLSKFTDYSTTINNAFKHGVLANRADTPSSRISESNEDKEQGTDLNDLLRRPSPPPSVEGFTLNTAWLKATVLLVPLGGLSVFGAAYRIITDTMFSGGLFIIVSFSASVYLITKGLYMLKCRRMVQNTPTSKIRSASMGVVELIGRAESGFQLLSPFRMVPSVFFQCRMYRRKTNDGSTGWQLSRSYSSGKLPFFITDETGRIKVQPNDALFCRSLFHRETINHDLESKTVLDIIPEGKTMYVLGFNQRKWHKKTVEDKIRERLQSIRYNRTDFARFDTNGDNRIDDEELLGAAAQIEAEFRNNSSGVISPSRDVTVGTSPHGRTPLIIASSERELIKRLGADILICLFSGFVVLALASAVMLSFI